MNIGTGSMNVQKLQPVNDESTSVKKYSSTGFEAFFDAAMNLFNETNIYQLDAEKLQLDYVTGKTDDIIALNMAQNRAATSIQFTSQVTNKVLSAYQEIMRIQM